MNGGAAFLEASILSSFISFSLKLTNFAIASVVTAPLAPLSFFNCLTSDPCDATWALNAYISNIHIIIITIFTLVLLLY